MINLDYYHKPYINTTNTDWVPDIYPYSRPFIDHQNHELDDVVPSIYKDLEELERGKPIWVVPIPPHIVW